MRDALDPSWDKDQLDAYLLDRYGHSYGMFELSYLNTYVLFHYFNLRAKSYTTLQFERQRLAELKERLIGLFDDYLNAIDFYKHSSNYESFKLSGITKWTDHNKRMFISKYLRLESTLAILNKPDDWFLKAEMEDDIIPYGFGITKGLRIDPLNFLILVWSIVLKRNARIDWITLSRLLLWLSEHSEMPKLNVFYGIEPRVPIGADVLRLTYNKYRRSRYFETAHTHYQMVFTNCPKHILKMKLEELRGWLELDLFKSPREYAKNIARFFLLASIFPEVFDPIYDWLSTESLEPKEVSQEEKKNILKLQSFIRSQLKS